MEIYYLHKLTSIGEIILGFDFGTKYIGVAIGQTITNTARPIACLKVINNHINWEKIDELIYHWKPQQLVIGIPIDLPKNKHIITEKCLSFGKKIEKRYHLPTHKVNEILSTWEAKKKLNLLKRSSFANEELLEINANAAAILVQQWMDDQTTVIN
jgi:putative holliday junction resolvase